jgi:hypothetical protein
MFLYHRRAPSFRLFSGERVGNHELKKHEITRSETWVILPAASALSIASRQTANLRHLPEPEQPHNGVKGRNIPLSGME